MRYHSKILDPTTCGIALETLPLTDLESVKVEGIFQSTHQSFSKLLKNFDIASDRAIGSRLTRPVRRRTPDMTQKAIFGFTLQDPEEHVGVLVPLTFDLHEGFGRYYGYHHCCVMDYIATRTGYRLFATKRKRAKQAWDPGNRVRHWVCPSCMSYKSPGELLEEVTKHRLCDIPYPQSVPKHQSFGDLALLMAMGVIR